MSAEDQPLAEEVAEEQPAVEESTEGGEDMGESGEGGGEEMNEEETAAWFLELSQMSQEDFERHCAEELGYTPEQTAELGEQVEQYMQQLQAEGEEGEMTEEQTAEWNSSLSLLSDEDLHQHAVSELGYDSEQAGQLVEQVTLYKQSIEEAEGDAKVGEDVDVATKEDTAIEEPVAKVARTE